MKVKYFVKYNDKDKYPWVLSDMVSGGIDLLELLLASDLASMSKINEFENIVFVKEEIWWFNATKVEIDGDFIKISPAFDIYSIWKIKVSILKNIICDWKSFINKKIDVTKEY